MRLESELNSITHSRDLKLSFSKMSINNFWKTTKTVKLATIFGIQFQTTQGI